MSDLFLRQLRKKHFVLSIKVDNLVVQTRFHHVDKEYRYPDIIYSYGPCLIIAEEKGARSKGTFCIAPGDSGNVQTSGTKSQGQYER
jgi:hypothetical protein